MTRTYQSALTVTLGMAVLVIGIAQYGTTQSAGETADIIAAVPSWALATALALMIGIVFGAEVDRRVDAKDARATIRHLQETIAAESPDVKTLAPGVRASVSIISKRLQQDFNLGGRAWIVFYGGSKYFHGNNKIEYKPVVLDVNSSTRFIDVARAIVKTYEDQIERCDVRFMDMKNDWIHRGTKLSSVTRAL